MPLPRLASVGMPGWLQLEQVAGFDRNRWLNSSESAVIARAQAFQMAGADMVMVPGLSDPREIEALCNALDIPVAAIVGLSETPLMLAELGRLGVRRVIVGSAFARVAMASVLTAAREAAQGTFGFTEGLVAFENLNGLFRRLASNPTSET
jgi:2-methylisocitrate lyase-like PEP mutase family enzyme